MAGKKWIVDLDLSKNQLLNAVIQNLATAPSAPKIGQMYYSTADDTAYAWTGAVWLDLGKQGTPYVHPSATNPSLTPTLTGANVLATFQTDAEGHVDVLTTRVLTLADLGYTGATDANNYVHPLAGVDLGAALSGATVISDVEVNSEGHVVGFATRELSAADIGAAIINDAATNSTDTWSSTKIDAEITAAFAGVATPSVEAYNASTNSPDLDVTPVGVIKGDIFYVSVAGTFFTEEMQIGDTLIAKIDNPTVLADWVRLEKNIPDIVASTETVAGIIEIATQAETDSGTDDTRAVTPLKLETRIGAIDTGAAKYVEAVGDGVSTAITVTHNLGTQDVQVTLRETATNDEVGHFSTAPTINTISLQFNTAPTASQYTVTVIG